MAECRIVKASQKEDFLWALSFVLPHEKTACALTRKILDREDGVYLIMRGTGREGTPGHSVVEGVFFFCEGDILLPCLTGIRSCGLRSLAAFLQGRDIFCISGLEDELRKLRPLLMELACPTRLRERRHYYFFEHRDRDAAGKAIARLPTDCKIQLASQDDEDVLFPLHLSYMAEEVLLPGGKMNEPFERQQLHECLKKQVVVMAVREGDGENRILAKAGTNAIASKVMQLGGVYTRKEERGKGLATALVAFLAESAAKKNLSTVLFVNKHNESAIAAYRRAGFQDCGKDYTIEYYGR